MLFYVLTQSTDSTLLFSDCKFKFLVQSMDTGQVLRTEQLQQERAYLREITENAFYLCMEAIIFGAIGHKEFRC